MTPFHDLAVQTLLVGGLVSVFNAVFALYFWNERRTERYLLFWAIALAINAVRWGTFYFALDNPRLAVLLSFMSAVVHFFIVLGCFDLLPGKPWKRPVPVALALAISLSFTFVGLAFDIAPTMEYVRSFAQLAFWAASMLWAFRVERLPGYAFGAATIAAWCIYVGTALYLLGGQGIATHVVVPLFNVPLMFSIIVIAYQRSRRDLLESERTLQKIFDTAPTPIVITRPPHGEIERANAVAVQLFGLAPDAAFGKSMVEHGLVIDPGAREEVYAELAAGRRVSGHIAVIPRPEGELRTVAINADRIVLESGIRYIFSVHDLTDLRRAESAAIESEKARQVAEMALQKERDELAHAQRVTTLGELAASLAHEVGQPLTAILSNAQAARRFRDIDPAHPEVGDALLDIANSARDAGDTIGRLRTLFRKGETQRTLLGVNALLEEVLRLLRSNLLHIHVSFEPAANLPAVKGDSVQLRQVLLNVLVNAEEAIKAAANGRREIHIRTARTGQGGVAISVRDTGVGVAESELERIFTHFVTNKPHGLGMGLAISRKIVQAHEGRIWATRAEPGLTLHIELPAA